MGPKRKKRRGKKRRRKGRKSPKGITNVEKELYEITIKTLTERLERREALIEELKRLKCEHEGKYDQMLADRNDAITYLEHEVQDKKHEVDSLRDELDKLEEIRQMERLKWQEDTRMLRSEMGEHIDLLQQENELLGEKLSSLEEFRLKKEEIEAHITDMETELLQKTEQYENELYKLEKLSIIDHDRLRKEMIRRVELAAEACRKFSEDHMHTTVKRAIVERVRMGVELKKTGDIAYKLSEENETLKLYENELNLKLKVSHECESEMSFMYQSQYENLKYLRKTCAEREKDQKVIDQLRSENEEFKYNTGKQTKWLDSLTSNASYQTDEVRRLTRKQMEMEKKLDKQANLIAGLSAIIQECSRCIKQGITEFPVDEESKVEYLGKRQMMLLQLIDTMERAAEMSYTDCGDLLLSRYQATLPAVDPWLVDKPPIQYQMGDLGIFPKHNPEKEDKMAEIEMVKTKVPVTRKFRGASTLKPSTKTILGEIGLLTKFEQLDRTMHELH